MCAEDRKTCKNVDFLWSKYKGLYKSYLSHNTKEAVIRGCEADNYKYADMELRE